MSSPPLSKFRSPPLRTVRRFIVFGAVAIGGLIVQLAFLGLLYRVVGTEYIVALALSVVLAMTFNFSVHNVLTFRDRRLKGVVPSLKGWLLFCLVSAIGGAFNMTVAAVCYAIGWHWALAGVAGAGAGGLVNFALASRYTWTSIDG